MSCTRTPEKKSEPHKQADDPPRRRANKRRGHGSYATDRPPIFSVKGRESGQVRYFVRQRSDSETCVAVWRAAVKTTAQVVNTDEWQGYNKLSSHLGLSHATVKHGKAGSGVREWARDDDGDGVREVHCNGCEGAGAALRTYLRGFRGVHKKYLECYVASYETMTNAKRFSPVILQRMCFLQPLAQSKEI